MRRNGAAPDVRVDILFKVPLTDQPEHEPPRPHPEFYNDRHGHDFVRMPCSPSEVSTSSSVMQKIPFAGSYFSSGPQSVWESSILKTLQSKISNIKNFKKVIGQYNPGAVHGTSGFAGLSSCLDYMQAEERNHFFQSDLPAITRLARDLPGIVTTAPPLLRAGSNSCVSLSQYQVACLLANAFLCTFPDRNGTVQRSHGGTTLPDFNFDRLFERFPDASRGRQKVEKLRCILNYFRRVTFGTPPCGTLTIARCNNGKKTADFWRHSNKPLLKQVNISANGSIDEDGSGMLQVDFANEYIGGGVLGNGLVQEEIRFLKFPELIVTRLLCERMEDDEAILVVGAQRYNECQGYASSFKWTGDFHDATPWDKSRRSQCQIVAMDAMDFSGNPESQYQLKNVLRELNKAYAGFRHFSKDLAIGGNELAGVATGNWGCGAFGGDPQLKFLIQLMAISEAGRERMSYFTFMNKPLAEELKRVHKLLLDRSVTVGQLFMMLESYGQLGPYRQGSSVFQVIKGQLGAFGDRRQTEFDSPRATPNPAQDSSWQREYFQNRDAQMPLDSAGSHEHDGKFPC